MKPIFWFRHFREEKLPSHHFIAGDTIALIDQNALMKLDDYQQQKHEERPPIRLFYQAMGIVQSVYPNFAVQFPFWPPSLYNINYLNQSNLYRIERLPNFVTLNRSIQALEQLIDNDQLAIRPLLNISDNIDKEELKDLANEIVSHSNNIDDLDYISASINKSQRQAIMCALQKRLTLIQGPPGTGKTETSAMIIRLWLKLHDQIDEQQPILVCAETHQAIDNLTRRLIKFVRVVRYGEPRTIGADLQEYTMQAQIDLLRRHNSPNKQLFGPPKPKEIRQIISSCQVLAMTCAGVGILEKDYRFPFILIDEASQITEPNILISLIRITKQIVLVGDQKQLPPIIKMEEAKPLLERSFFQRMIENIGIEVHMLDTQYRMHPALIQFPIKKFYNNQLKNGVTSQDRPQPKTIKFIDKNCPLMFVDVANGEEMCRGSNIENREEVILICETVKTLLPSKDGEYQPNDIGIITPYRKQVMCITEKLSQMQIPKGVEIRTVDGFQGREKTVILISLVRSNSDHEIGFLVNEQRMNVLLTRAKCAMIVFGNKLTLSANSVWKEWIDSVPNVSSDLYKRECLVATPSNNNRSSVQQQEVSNTRGRGQIRGRASSRQIYQRGRNRRGNY